MHRVLRDRRRVPANKWCVATVLTVSANPEDTMKDEIDRRAALTCMLWARTGLPGGRGTLAAMETAAVNEVAITTDNYCGGARPRRRRRTGRLTTSCSRPAHVTDAGEISSLEPGN
jgi:hypothetical protein